MQFTCKQKFSWKKKYMLSRFVCKQASIYGRWKDNIHVVINLKDSNIKQENGCVHPLKAVTQSIQELK